MDTGAKLVMTLLNFDLVPNVQIWQNRHVSVRYDTYTAMAVLSGLPLYQKYN